MAVTISIDLTLRVCTRCGCPFGIPAAVVHYQCPSCAAAKVHGLEGDADALREDIARRDRVNAALRGAMTKLRRR